MLNKGRDWQSRALGRMYPSVLFSALRVNIRGADSRAVKDKAACVAFSITRAGQREALGWQRSESSPGAVSLAK